MLTLSLLFCFWSVSANRDHFSGDLPSSDASPVTDCGDYGVVNIVVVNAVASTFPIEVLLGEETREQKPLFINHAEFSHIQLNVSAGAPHIPCVVRQRGKENWDGVLREFQSSATGEVYVLIIFERFEENPLQGRLDGWGKSVATLGVTAENKSSDVHLGHFLVGSGDLDSQIMFHKGDETVIRTFYGNIGVLDEMPPGPCDLACWFAVSDEESEPPPPEFPPPAHPECADHPPVAHAFIIRPQRVLFAIVVGSLRNPEFFPAQWVGIDVDAISRMSLADKDAVPKAQQSKSSLSCDENGVCRSEDAAEPETIERKPRRTRRFSRNNFIFPQRN